ncbi:DUF4240 domain-containing protein [Nonomuraea sp. ZG12]|uniref:DUF4240 domain-containing protein n=1 Tax=Nonomuraea sp. ZG12 TaxID=3452207 RepID=UPI003F8ADB9D
MADQWLPAGDEDRFWDLVEAAWAPLGPEAGQARQALVSRTPDPDVDPWEDPALSLVQAALPRFLDSLAALGRELSAAELASHDRVAERKLYDIDRADVHAATGGSDDGFLYARGFIVALGRDFYEAVARDPEMAVYDAECEEMCYFFAHLHDKHFGYFPDTGSAISRESCNNPAGWPS